MSTTVVLEMEPPDETGWQEKVTATFEDDGVRLERWHRDGEADDWRPWQDCGIRLSATALGVLLQRQSPPPATPLDALGEARALVDAQAEDIALWAPAATAPEAYVQRALRDLHAAVEAASTPTEKPPGESR